ncbi:dihydroorotate dehydrogenase electron transfer subunit [Desulfurobacterium atlanticum]|uniref:Dihydroorotate dehydrogenase electron transfer subunit n=1 Tax=Desulfurobacterium atlanticum TaxID=240169 RepID=A0A238YMQ5_9BACT|nr:dihydroorotate dehydrogenase electron transfer subunit [Desulfurobacterium atlanticum]SNR72417.1 dihydroorotate dehydrogenase electron transfer subunit [Desulfurobacterium atlanticum]
MKGKIVENRPLTGKDFLLTIEICPEIVEKVKPGQFAMIDVKKPLQTDPLLKRPLGIFDTDKNRVSFIYRVVGRGTKLLTEMKDEVDVLLPLGNHFKDEREKYLFIAGGIGIGGIFLAAKTFHRKGKTVKVIYGGRTKDDLSALPFLEKYHIPFIPVTEDGSFGEKGLVTDFLKSYKNFRWIACGPKGMLNAVKKIAEKENIECYLSIDTRMACGVGSCLGCVIKTPEGYKRTCVEGPIFKASEIDL